MVDASPERKTKFRRCRFGESSLLDLVGVFLVESEIRTQQISQIRSAAARGEIHYGLSIIRIILLSYKINCLLSAS